MPGLLHPGPSTSTVGVLSTWMGLSSPSRATCITFYVQSSPLPTGDTFIPDPQRMPATTEGAEPYRSSLCIHTYDKV